ncbi:MAG: sigma-E processing peptidase SpoIIGA [Lachnospiraceae bacterium]|nr:sigma-E processing peptidase SpoIIGA [Lachnospiraceae bacterium]
MKYVVYVDVLFFQSAVLNTILLTGYYLVFQRKKQGVLKRRFALVRCVLAGVFGALFGVLILIYIEETGFKILLGYILLLFMLCMVEGRMFRWKYYKQYCKELLFVGVSGAVFKGMMDAFVLRVPYEDRSVRYSFGSLLEKGGAVGIFMLVLYMAYQRRQGQQRRTRMVSLWIDGICLEGKGLWDTGNCLREPISGKPVIIMEESEAKKYLPKTIINTKVRFVPYHSIGKEQGVLPALLIDKFQSETKDAIYKGVYVAFTKERVSESGQYRFILHKDL